MKPHQWCIAAGLLLVAVACLFPPYEMHDLSGAWPVGRHFIFKPYGSIAVLPLALELLVITVAASIPAYILKNHGR